MLAIKSWNKAYVFLIPLVIIAAFFQLAFLQHTLKFDMTEQFLPWRFYVGECLQSHQLPFWNPYSMMGYPVCSDPQGSAWYPISWFFGYFCGYNYSVMSLEFMLHLFIAAAGMWQLSRRMGAMKETAAVLALCWACSGVMVGNAQHMSWIVSAAWLPWAFYGFHRLLKELSWQSSLFFALVIYMMLSGGYAAVLFILMYVFLFAFIWYIVRYKTEIKIPKTIGILFFTLFIILLLSCVVLVAIMMNNEYSVRGGATSIGQAMSNPFTFSSLITFLFPAVSVGNSELFGTDQSMVNGYIGFLTILFVITSWVKYYKQRRVILWTVLALSCWLAGLGPDFFLREFLYDYVPLMNLFRHPSVFRIFLMLSLLMIAIPALNDLFSGKLSLKDFKISFPAFLIFLILCLLVIFSKEITHSNELKRQLVYDGVILIAGVIIFFRREKISLTVLTVGFFVLFSVDMIVAVQRNIRWTVVSNDKVSENNTRLKNLPRGFVLRNDTLVNSEYNPEQLSGWRNTNIYYKKVAYDGYNPYLSEWQYEMLYGTGAKSERWKQPLFLFTETSAHIDSLNASACGVSCKINSEKAGSLTVLQSYFPQWKAYVDGRETAIHRENINMLGISVPAGVHHVLFEYKPAQVIYAFIISAITFSGIIVMLIVFRIKQKKS